LACVHCQNAQGDQDKPVKDEKVLEVIKEKDQLLTEKDEQLGAIKNKLKRAEFERDELLRGFKVK